MTTIDAARGAAMFFVFLAHFADIVVVSPSTRIYGEQLAHIGMIASPLFIIVSGTVLGFLCASRADDFRDVRYRMIDRSLLLLTIAHVLIAVANMPRLRHPSDAWRMVFITDTIAICAIAGCALIRILPARFRIAFGLLCYAISWAVVIWWHPADLQTRFIKDLVVGPFEQESWAYVVPILPWFAVYIAATTIGERLARFGPRMSPHHFALQLIRLGVGAFVVGTVLKLGYLVLLKLHVVKMSAQIDIFHQLTGPFAKIPPSPDYLAVFGGAGLALLGLLIRNAHRPQLAGLMNWLALVGRNSLFVFIVQYYVYFVLLHAFRFPVTTWPLLFGTSVVGIVAIALWWDRSDGNRFLTVGVVRFVRQRRARTTSRSTVDATVDATTVLEW